MLLEFYRSQARRLFALEELKRERGGHILSLPHEEREEYRKLNQMLREPEPAFSIASLLVDSADVVVISDDPIWNRYMTYAKAKSADAIPDSWFGDGARGKALKAKALANEAEKRKAAS